MLMQAKNAVGSNTPGAASSAADLAPSWRPKTLRNRGQNPKKSMLKSNTFLGSILSGFGHRFSKVFGRFFGHQIHAKSNLKKNVRDPFCIVKTNTKSMLALATSSKNRTKIGEKSHFFWNVDFKRILASFWEGFGKPKPLIFTFFSMFFRCKI